MYRLVQASPLWDGRDWVLQVVDTTPSTMVVRGLVSSADAPSNWGLRCDVREKLLAFLLERHPGALPKVRADISGAGDSFRRTAADTTDDWYVGPGRTDQQRTASGESETDGRRTEPAGPRGENEYLADHGFAEYQRWYLGIDDEAGRETKERYKFPFGKYDDIEAAAAHPAGPTRSRVRFGPSCGRMRWRSMRGTDSDCGVRGVGLSGCADGLAVQCHGVAEGADWRTSFDAGRPGCAAQLDVRR